MTERRISGACSALCRSLHSARTRCPPARAVADLAEAPAKPPLGSDESGREHRPPSGDVLGVISTADEAGVGTETASSVPVTAIAISEAAARSATVWVGANSAAARATRPRGAFPVTGVSPYMSGLDGLRRRGRRAVRLASASNPLGASECLSMRTTPAPSTNTATVAAPAATTYMRRHRTARESAPRAAVKAEWPQPRYDLGAVGLHSSLESSRGKEPEQPLTLIGRERGRQQREDDRRSWVEAFPLDADLAARVCSFIHRGDPGQANVQTAKRASRGFAVPRPPGSASGWQRRQLRLCSLRPGTR
jgi:hypothetical protein